MVNITRIPGGNFSSNVYIIEDEIDFIIDVGMGNCDNILNKIEERGLSIEKIILTHRHYDHVGSVKELSEKLNIPIFAHRLAAEALRQGDDRTIISRSFGVNMPEIEVQDLEDNIISKFEIIHTPGHTECSISLYHDESDSLISGDTVFASGGVGRTDLPTGNMNELIKSIEKLTEYDVKSLYPGHGPIVENKADEHIERSLKNISYL